jgi:hypothetical protein
LVDWSIPFEIFPANELRIAATAIIERKEEEEEQGKGDNRQLICKKCMTFSRSLVGRITTTSTKNNQRS